MTEPLDDTELACSQLYSTQEESGRFARAADGLQLSAYEQRFTGNGSRMARMAGETPPARVCLAGHWIVGRSHLAH
jgi:hypothetical protein